MSRTNRGEKPSGFDYWGRRGMADKNTTKRRERRKRERDLHDVRRTRTQLCDTFEALPERLEQK